jgi:hypothetical protein
MLHIIEISTCEIRVKHIICIDLLHLVTRRLENSKIHENNLGNYVIV